MKPTKILIILILNILIPSFADFDHPKFKPACYFGADLLYANISFHKHYGSNVFAKNFIALNGFVGFTLNNRLGIETGFERAKNKRRHPTIPGGEYVTGWLMPSIIGQGFIKSKLKQQHPYIGLTYTNSINPKTFSTILIGASLSKIYAKYDISQPNFFISPEATITNFSKTKWVAIAKITYGYKLTNYIAARLVFNFRNTTRFKMKSPDTISKNLAKPNNYFGGGLGLLFFW